MKIWLTIIIFSTGLALLTFSVPGQETDGMGERKALEIKAFFSGISKANDFLKKGDYNQALAHHRQFLEKYPRSRYAALSYLRIAAIYRDYLNDYDRAGEMYERVLAWPGEDKLTQLSRKLAGNWGKRIKLAVIEQALNRYYAREVEYPASLNALLLKGYLKEDCLRAPEGSLYFYRSKSSRLFPKLKRQEYILYSSNSGKGEPSLSLLIEEEKAFSRQFSLQGLMEGPRGKKAIINYVPGTSSGKQKAEILSEGEKLGGAQVLEITDEGVILNGRETLLILTMGR